MKQIKKYNLVAVILLMLIPIIATASRTENETTKEIVEEFDVNENSKVYFKHRRGALNVKYIEGSKGRVEATITVKGDNKEDIQDILEAMSLEVSRNNGWIEIETANKIVSWNSRTGLWGSKYKIVLSNGKVINTKVDDITIHATLYLPKIDYLSLSNRYDDIYIEAYQADNLKIDIHSATLKTADLMSDTHIKIRYGKLDVQKVKNLNLDSHDSKGTVGDIRDFVLKDKYSNFEFGNLQSLNANTHDADLVFGAIRWDGNIKDKYSKIKIGDFEDGKWDLHDSKVQFNTAVSIIAKSKYTTINGEFVEKLSMDSHDDDVKVDLVSILDMKKSKYTKVSLRKLGKMLIMTDSHDDTIVIESSSDKFKGITFNAKYTDLNLPLREGLGFAIEANMKYGQLQYPEKGLKEMRYVKDGSDLEVRGVAADGSKEVMITITGHDCKVDLGN